MTLYSPRPARCPHFVATVVTELAESVTPRPYHVFKNMKPRAYSMDRSDGRQGVVRDLEVAPWVLRETKIVGSPIQLTDNPWGRKNDLLGSGVPPRVAEVASHVLWWFQASERQGDRIRIGKSTSEVGTDAHFFAIALRNLLRVCELATNELSSDPIKGAVDEFVKAVPGTKDVRDVLGHFDDYICGTGRLQKNGNISQMRWSYKSYSTESGHRGLKIVLGDGAISLDIDSSVAAARTLAECALSEIEAGDLVQQRDAPGVKNH